MSMSTWVKYLEPRNENMSDVRLTVPSSDTLQLAQGDNVIRVHADDISQLIYLLQSAIRVADHEVE